jgi:hypothetical protein
MHPLVGHMNLILCTIVVVGSSPTRTGWHDEEWNGDEAERGDPSMLSYDPCVAVCENLSASGRGNGFDLCDNVAQSYCLTHINTPRVCSYLYCSHSPDHNELGLVYSVESSELTTTERGLPLLCHEADQIVNNQFNVSLFNRTSEYH